MRKSSSDSKVKKTLVRDCEQKIRKGSERVLHDVDAASSRASAKSSSSKGNELDRPSLCSSQALAKYLVDAKKSLPVLQSENLNIHKEPVTAKMTKMLNFHFNDRIYKNLVELNAGTASVKNKKDKKPTRPSSVKKDLEPSIEDFCEEENELDTCPSIPVMKPKFKPIQPAEDVYLHRLVASFECL